MKSKPVMLYSLAALIGPGLMLAQTVPGSTDDLNLSAIISTLLYGAIGIVLCLGGYLAFDRLIKLDLRRELVEDQNIALGVMLAGVFIGIAIVISAAMR